MNTRLYFLNIQQIFKYVLYLNRITIRTNYVLKAVSGNFFS